jgi:hypothetical protein
LTLRWVAVQDPAVFFANDHAMHSMWFSEG